VRTFYNAEVKRINAVLAPLGVQIDPSDAEEVRTAMLHWRSMKDRLAPGFGTFQELCKRDKERNMFAWEFKNELDKSVWAEGKKEAKLKALGLIPAVSGDAAGKVLGVVKEPPSGPRRGRPKGGGNKAKQTSASKDRADRTPDGGRKSAKQSGASPGRRGAALQNRATERDAEEERRRKERLMLQLFPVDRETRAALVAAGFNPHLELTFRAKKPVTSLMEHLAQKWAAAVPHLPPASRGAEEGGIAREPETRALAPCLQLYPFEAPSAAEAAGAWNHAHDGVTATDIFDACGRPAAFRVRYGWVPAEEAARAPYLPPPPPPVRGDRADSRSRSRSASRSASPPQNLSPRKRAAEEMRVAHDSFCDEPVRGGAFAGIAFGDARAAPNAAAVSAGAASPFVDALRSPGGFAGGGGGAAHQSIFGSDLAGAALLFGTPTRSSRGGDVGGVPAGTPTPGGVHASGGVHGDFTLSGFGDGDFSNMCREMGLDGEPHHPAARNDGDGGAPPGLKSTVEGMAPEGAAEAGAGGVVVPRAPSPLASAAPGELTLGYAAPRRHVLGAFDAEAPRFGAGEGSVADAAAMLEAHDDGLFSLTRMLGDVDEEEGAHVEQQTHTLGGEERRAGVGDARESALAPGAPGPTNFAGMFGGRVSEKAAERRARDPRAEAPGELAAMKPGAAYYPHQAPQGEGVEGVLAAEAAEGSRGAELAQR
jgi:hypothetical protein